LSAAGICGGETAINAGRMTAIKRKTMERVKDEEELTTKMLG
jgi:hypothetical protein